jgi:hypothetical protein
VEGTEGAALDEMVRWLVGRRQPAWMLNVLRWLPMSAAVKWEIYDQIRIDDPSPELREQWHWLVDRLFDLDPTVGEKIRESGRHEEARKALRRVLTRRCGACSRGATCR